MWGHKKGISGQREGEAPAEPGIFDAARQEPRPPRPPFEAAWESPCPSRKSQVTFTEGISLTDYNRQTIYKDMLGIDNDTPRRRSREDLGGRATCGGMWYGFGGPPEGQADAFSEYPARLEPRPPGTRAKS